VTVPGLGRGQFAGPFHGRLDAHLARALERLLARHGAELPNLAAVRFDPYGECEDRTSTIHGISYRVRPSKHTRRARRSPLCRPEAYAEAGDDFSGRTLAGIVAWDHVSWPGHDCFAAARCTDDGVKAAATDSMRAVTGVEGHDDRAGSRYRPPAGFTTWGDVAHERIALHGLRLRTPDAIWCHGA
jgi:hypothetical protein